MSAVLMRGGRVMTRDDRVLMSPISVREIVVRSMGVQDDDMRVRVGNLALSDTRWNVGWYRGEHFLTSAVPPFAPYTEPDHWRVVRVSDADLLSRLRLGDVVSVDVFDGWGGNWSSSPWVAEVTLGDGSRRIYNGGVARTGVSTGANPGVNDYSTGPHFLSYIPNGEFVL